MILVDTCIWSLAFRRRAKDRSAAEEKLFFTWRDLVIRGDAGLIGPIRQELLSGIGTPSTYAAVRMHLDTQVELPLDTNMWNLAAEFFNTCKGKGIAPDAIDMTICAAASLLGIAIFTVDPDFERYARHIPVALFPV